MYMKFLTTYQKKIYNLISDFFCDLKKFSPHFA